MYKQQKPISLSSTVWALIITAVVLLIAASANAQTTIEASSTVTVTPSLPASVTNPPTGPTASSSPVNTTALPMPNAPMVTADQAAAVTVTGNLDTYRAAVAARRTALEEKRNILSAASSTRQAVLSAAAQETIKNGTAAIAITLNQAIGHLKEILAHLQEKADGSAGAQSSAGLVSSLQGASAAIALAETALIDVDLNARFAATSNQPAADWISVREQLTDVRSLIQEAQGSLRAAADSLEAVLTAPPAANL